jgi:maleylpyruvate isomerase
MTASVALPEHAETLLATQRYLQALTGIDDGRVRRPSVLPGWSRAHVVAHVARNADAFIQLLGQVLAGEPAYMYASQDQRNADIDTTAGWDLADLRSYSIESCAGYATAAEKLDAGRLDAPVSRTPGGPVFPVSMVGRMRRTEVEIHHADLDVGYTAHDWPDDFTTALVKRRQDELAKEEAGGPSMVLVSTTLHGLWKLGAGQGPTIEGAAADLAWWLVGRGDGQGLTCSAGPLPTLARWR